MRFREAAFQTSAAQSAAAVFQVLVGIVTARLLGAHDRGLYSLFFTTVGFGLNFLTLGLPQATVYYANRDKDRRGRLFSNAAAYWCVLTCALAAFALAAPESANALWNGPHGRGPALLLAVAVAGMLANGLIAGVVLGLHRYDTYNLNILLQSGGVLLSALALLCVAPTIEFAVGLRVLAVVAVAVIFAAGAAHAPDFALARPSGRVFREQLRFGSKNYAQNLIGLANARIFLYLLAAFHGPTLVGYVSVAQLFTEGMRLFPNAIGTVLFPKLTTIDDHEEANALTAAVCRYTIAGACAAAGLFALGAPWLIRGLFGVEYLPAVPALRVMVLGAAVNCLYQILTRHFTSRHLQRYSIAGGAAALAAGLGAAFLWIPAYGVLGAAAAYTVSGVVAGLLLAGFFIRRSGLPARRVLLLDAADLSRLWEILPRRTP